VSAWVLYLAAGSGVVLGLVTVASRGGRDGAALAALAVAGYAGGSLLGTMAAGWRRPPSPWAAIAACLGAVAAGALLVAAGLALTIVLGALVFGAGEGFFLVVYLTLRAERTPDQLMGRISGATRMLATITGGVGVAWMGLALQWLGGGRAFGLLAVLGLALAAWVAVTAPRNGERVFR
jgi:hypothetical protein